MDLVRLACVRHAASVRPEPGSNSPSRSLTPARRSSSFDQESRSRAGCPRPTGTVLASFRETEGRPESALLELMGRQRSGEPARGLPHSPFWHPLFRCQGSLASRRGPSRNVGPRPPGVPFPRRPTGSPGRMTKVVVAHDRVNSGSGDARHPAGRSLSLPRRRSRGPRPLDESGHSTRAVTRR